MKTRLCRSGDVEKAGIQSIGLDFEDCEHASGDLGNVLFCQRVALTTTPLPRRIETEALSSAISSQTAGSGLDNLFKLIKPS
jgi:hypothetical protein